MKTILSAVLIGLSFGLMGCASLDWATTPGEQLSGFSYVPIDPFPVLVAPAHMHVIERVNSDAEFDVLDLFPDNAVRISVLEKTSKGKVSFGSSTVGVAGNSYKVIVDYINADTVNLDAIVIMSADIRAGNPIGDFFGQSDTVFISPAELGSFRGVVPGSERYYVFSKSEFEGIPEKRNTFASKMKKLNSLTTRIDEYDNQIADLLSQKKPVDNLEQLQLELREKTIVLLEEIASIRELIPEKLLGSPELPLNYQEYSIPVYVGIGLRVVADIEVLEGKVDITGLAAIGSAAQLKKVSGTLSVQTLGINGEQVASALPIQSELNQTTAQNAIVSVASIKTLLYDNGISKRPRVVGLYLPFRANEALVNRVLSLIARMPPQWKPTAGVVNISDTDPQSIITERVD